MRRQGLVARRIRRRNGLTRQDTAAPKFPDLLRCDFTALCRRLGIRQSMGRVGSCFDNAAAEAFFSSLEWEVLSRNDFDTTTRARAVVIDWCYGLYNHRRRHSAAAGLSPINYENAALNRDAAY
jgi:transposase InsO family protein